MCENPMFCLEVRQVLSSEQPTTYLRGFWPPVSEKVTPLKSCEIPRTRTNHRSRLAVPLVFCVRRKSRSCEWLTEVDGFFFDSSWGAGTSLGVFIPALHRCSSVREGSIQENGFRFFDCSVLERRDFNFILGNLLVAVRSSVSVAFWKITMPDSSKSMCNVS